MSSITYFAAYMRLTLLAILTGVFLMSCSTSKKAAIKTRPEQKQTKTIQDTLQFDAGSNFINGFAHVINDSTSFYINRKGQRVFDAIVRTANKRKSRRLFEQDKKGNSVEKGEPPEYYLMVYSYRDSTYGVISTTGKWLLKPKYDIIDTQRTYWRLIKNGKLAYYMGPGSIMPFIDSLKKLDERRLAVQKNGKWGVFDTKIDEMMIPTTYQAIIGCAVCNPNRFYLFVQKNGLWGIVNLDNKILIPFEYDNICKKMPKEGTVWTIPTICLKRYITCIKTGSQWFSVLKLVA